MSNATDSIYDLIIVGAGPAGAAAALYAGRAGLRALLLDKARFPRDKICGDGLSGKAVTALRDLGLLESVRNLPGAAIHTVVFSSPDGVEAPVDLRRSGRQEYHTGFTVRRKILDHFLFEEARKTADTVEGFAVHDLIVEDGQVCGVRGELAGRSQPRSYRGRIVLGADGFSSVVARRAGIYRHDPAHWIVALRGYYRRVKGLRDQIELHYVDGVLPGYFWIFPVEDGCANVGIGMVCDQMKRKKVNLRAALQQTIEGPRFRDRFAEAAPEERPVGWNLPLGSIRRKNHGNGFLLLGDAAGLIDPFTGEGIGNALYSARHAAECAREACDAGDFSERFLSRYDTRLWDEIGDELAVSARLQKLGRIRPLLNFVLHRAEASQKVRDLICGMIADEVPKKHLANPLFYMKLLFT